MFCFLDQFILMCGGWALLHDTIKQASSSSSKTVEISVCAWEPEQTCTYGTSHSYSVFLLLSAALPASHLSLPAISSAWPHASCPPQLFALQSPTAAVIQEAMHQAVLEQLGLEIRSSVFLLARRWEAVWLSRWLPPLPVRAWGDGHSSSVLMSQSDQTAGSEACCSTVWHTADVLTLCGHNTHIQSQAKGQSCLGLRTARDLCCVELHITYIIAYVLDGWYTVGYI